MKKIMTLFLVTLLCFSCTEPTKDDDPYHKLIGMVNLKLERTAADGTYLNDITVDYYLEGTKVELINNGNIVETTYTKPDYFMDAMFILEKAESGKLYKLRISINEVHTIESDTFIIEDSDIVFLDRKLIKLLTGRDNISGWFNEGNYFADFLSTKQDETTIFINSNNAYLSSYPNPFSNKSYAEYSILKSSDIKLDILDIKLNHIKNLMDKALNSGHYTLTFGEDLDDGLYILRLKHPDYTNYHAILKGDKGYHLNEID